MNTIEAKIPASTVKSRTGKVFNRPESIRVFEQDEDGRWYAVHDGELDAVIADCRGASNWDEIRSAHFPMDGFHR